MNATASGAGHDSHGLGWVLQLFPPPRVDMREEPVEHFPEYCASAPEQTHMSRNVLSSWKE